MAKELPYFKFEPNQWENGNIQMMTREEKGLFIDLCSMYWSRLGDLPLKLAIQKLCAGNATALNSLCDEKIIEVINGSIFIKFLSEQLNEFKYTSKQNSKNAKERWEKYRKKKQDSERNANALNSQSEIDAIREEKRREEEIKEDNNINTPTARFSFFNSLISLGVNKQIANDWIAVRKNKKLTNTETAFKNLEIEFKKCGRPVSEIIEKCVTESWGGFKASWDWKENNLKTLNNGKKGYTENRQSPRNRV